MKKNFISCISFLLIFSLLFAGFHQVLQYRFEDEDGIEGMKQFYKTEENSVDVLFLGSSHVFVDVNTAVLWEEYGIAAFDLGGTIQPFWNTYFYLKEALKTQKPKLLVMDCFAASLTENYADESGIIKNTFGMKLSKNKTEAVKASAPDKYLSYLLGYPGYHARYSVLGRQDFVENKGIVDFDSWKGNHLLTETADNIADLRMYHIKEIKETEALHPKEEEYLQKIIDLAKEENIPLLLIATPYFPTEREVRVFNRVAEIAEQNEITFINYNYYYDEMGLDFTTDFADGHHLNIKGSPKFTRFLAEDIKASYQVPDHRGETAYADYDVMTEVYHQRVCDQTLAEFAKAGDLQGFMALAEKDTYLMILNVNGNVIYQEKYAWLRDRASGYEYLDENYQNTPCGDCVNQIMVLDHSELISGAPMIVFSHTADELPDTTGKIWHTDLGDYDAVTVRLPNETDMQNGYTTAVIDYNNQIYCAGRDAITIFVYDKRLKTLVGSFEFR